MDKAILLQKLKAAGQRTTPSREAILDFILSHHSPFAAPELLDHLSAQGLKVNKTTVYRQIEALLVAEVLQEVNLNDGVIRYELKQDDCHHHLVCIICGKVEHVELDETMDEIQTKLETDTGFEIQDHMLEFFGRCSDCKSKG
jgi:Fe2+ or Zn2+ uptake regulation protein